MISRRGKMWRLAPVILVLLVGLLVAGMSACSAAAPSDKTLTLAAVFPGAGADAAVGQAMQRAVDLAVQQNVALPKGYTLTVTHLDEASVGGDALAASIVSDHHIMGVVGPFDSQTALAMLPTIAQSGIVTISPTATLPGLTRADQAAAEGISYVQIHPKGTPTVFLRLPQTDTAMGKVAADLAIAPASGHGLGARSAFIVDDGTPSGKALAAAFKQELAAKHGVVAGQQSLVTEPQDNAQAIVSAIVEAAPDIVFYAGGIAAGADLRGTLSLTGVPRLPMLTAGPIADDPTWSATVGLAPASAYTTAILPARDLAALPDAKPFVSAYQSVFSGKDLLPQSALAYDAAMDEIAAIKALLVAGKPVTRAAVLDAVTAAKYPGVTGTLAFDANGDNTAPPGYSVYTCDIKGAWQYQTRM